MLHEEKVILQLSLKLMQLQFANDAAGLAALFDDELEAVAEDGRRVNKQQALQWWLDSSLQPQNVSEIRITLLGQTALETGMMQGASSAEMQRYCYSRLWLRRDNQWRLRGFQLTPVTPPYH